MKVFIILLFIFSKVSIADEKALLNYLYYGTSNPIPLTYKTVYFSDGGASTFYGDMGSIYNNCEIGFKCINIENTLLAIRDFCVNKIQKEDSWLFANTNYVVSNESTVYIDNIERKLYTIKYSLKQNKQISKSGIILYTNKGGIEFFTLNTINKKFKNYKSYHSVSTLGVFNKYDCEIGKNAIDKGKPLLEINNNIMDSHL